MKQVARHLPLPCKNLPDGWKCLRITKWGHVKNPEYLGRQTVNWGDQTLVLARDAPGNSWRKDGPHGAKEVRRRKTHSGSCTEENDLGSLLARFRAAGGLETAKPQRTIPDS